MRQQGQNANGRKDNAMRNPNGYGGIIKLSGKRRKPYMVRITAGWDEDKKQIFKVLGYFEKRTDAIAALSEYNKQPYNIDLAKCTFEQVYELWSKAELSKMKPQVQALHRSAYNQHCKKLYTRVYKTLRKHDFQGLIDDCPRGYSVKCSIRNLLSHLDAFAFDMDIIAKQYTTNLDVGEEGERKERNVFTNEEVQKLFDLVGNEFADATLVQLYTGFRVSELLALTDDSIEGDIIRGGGKTKAGTNRIVPIHPDIMPIIKAHMGQGKLFKTHSTQSVYLRDRKKYMESIGINHTTHECRHTFRSRLDSAGANKVSADLLMGHKSEDVGERVYTHKTIEELRETIMLLDYK